MVEVKCSALSSEQGNAGIACACLPREKFGSPSSYLLATALWGRENVLDDWGASGVT